MPLGGMTASAEASRTPAPSPEGCEATLRRYLPLIRDVAHTIARRKPPQIEFDELMSWGMEGLLDAYARFRPEKHASFGTYARFRVRGAILDNLREQDQLSRAARRKATLLERTRDRLEASLGRTPNEEELAHALQIDFAALRAMIADSEHRLISIEDVGSTDEEGRHEIDRHMPDVNSDPLTAVLAQERARVIAEALNRLPAKEHAAVTLYYTNDLTMREVGLVLGLTESRVSQLHSQALARLRPLLRPYVADERCAAERAVARCNGSTPLQLCRAPM